MLCQFKNSFYLCIRKQESTLLAALTETPGKKAGPFVYRLGRKIFILERGVRFPQGLQKEKEKEK